MRRPGLDDLRNRLAALVLPLLLAGIASAQEDPSPPAPAPEEPDEELAPLPERPKPPPPSDWAQWNDVERFRGFYECRRVTDMRRDSGTGSEEGHSEHVATARFEHRRGAFGQGWTFTGGETSGSWHETGASHRSDYHGQSGKDATFEGASPDMRLNIDTKRGKWTFSPADMLPQTYTLTFWLSSRKLEGYAWVPTERTSTEQRASYPTGIFRGELETGRPSPIRGVWTYAQGTLKETRTDARARVFLVPEFKDVELVLELEGVMPGGQKVPYEKWIPRGSPGGGAGSHLVVKARLQAVDGGALQATVESFTFRLEETSREPGVCMNFPRVRAPVPGKPATFDLKFVVSGAPDPTRQELEVLALPEDRANPHVEARVECLDYGAWSDLTVSAALADGRTITGHLKGDRAAIVIPLPKRSGGSRIADAWKAERGISAGDDDDREKLPVPGKAPGDGFTLYEEYRGFMENGKHLEGDPKKIDFFVRNFIGGDAVVGIEKFAQLTGAVVHRELVDAEFDKEKRVMNANHNQGPHAVDQHGVYLLTESGTDGAVAVFTVAGVRGRPKITKGISVQPRGASTSITTAENLRASDLVFIYDLAIVHELLHSVGVEHHGAGDEKKHFILCFADNPENKTGKPAWKQGDHFVTILDETTGRDLAVEMESKIRKDTEDLQRFAFNVLRAMLKDRPDITDAQIWDRVKLDKTGSSRTWYVGAQGGECSGDEGCVMRYFFARLYEKKGDPNTLYFISKRPSERAGWGLCRFPQGTGVNASGRNPQPRYGDAMGGCGACADWIVFNDAVPPDPEPVQPGKK